MPRGFEEQPKEYVREMARKAGQASARMRGERKAAGLPPLCVQKGKPHKYPETRKPARKCREQ